MFTTAQILLSVAAQATAIAAPSETQAATAEAIDAVVVAAMEAPEAVGLSVAVALGGEIVLARGYGLAEVEHDVKADADTSFRIGSVTKQFTAAAILRLYEKEALHIDEDVGVYLPEYPVGERVITVRNLLTHTAGIPNYTDLGPVFWEKAREDLSHEGMLELFAELPLEFYPGQRWAYSNSGYYLLGMIVESASGSSYADYLQEEFFGPLGLTRTRYGVDDEIIKNRAQGYTIVDGAVRNDAPLSMNVPGAAGALIASARDLVRWALALASGEVVSPASYAEMTAPFLLDDMTETNYGMGLQLGNYGGRPMVHHGGGIFGFNSHLAHLPEEQITVAVISNCEAFSSEIVTLNILKLLTMP